MMNTNWREMYCRGRILWVQALAEKDPVSWMRRCLNDSFEIPDSKIFVLSAQEFLQFSNRSHSLVKLEKYRTLIIHDLESVSQKDWGSFVQSLKVCHWLRFLFELRTVLLSSNSLLIERKNDLLKARLQSMDGFSSSVPRLSADQRVQKWIKAASLKSGRKVLRLSERAAFFLETLDEDWRDDEVLLLLEQGILRMTDGVLRLSHILPHFDRVRPSPMGGQTI